MATRAPRSASRSAIPRPIPLDPPVTRAHFPSRNAIGPPSISNTAAGRIGSVRGFSQGRPAMGPPPGHPNRTRSVRQQLTASRQQDETSLFHSSSMQRESDERSQDEEQERAAS